MRHAIVIPSIGRRPWWPLSASTFAHYCQRYGIALHVERHLPTREELPLPELPDSPGRPYKAAYIAKQFFAWKYLWGYDRVAVIDDTCFVRPITPDIFSEVPHGYCGYTRTSRNAAEKSFAYIREFIAGRGEAQIEYDPNRYMNSGVMVYDTSMRGALSPDELARCADLLYSPHPDQTVLYYLLHRHNVPMHRLSKKFNNTPGPAEGRIEITDLEPYIGNKYIQHITGAYVHRERLLYQAGEIYLREWATHL